MSSNKRSELATGQSEPTGGGEPSVRSSGFSAPVSSNAPPSIELYIEELVLHGFEPAARYLIGAAVERELTRLCAAQGVPTALGHARELARLDAGAVEIEPGLDAELTGALLAQAIYGGLGQ